MPICSELLFMLCVVTNIARKNAVICEDGSKWRVTILDQTAAAISLHSLQGNDIADRLSVQNCLQLPVPSVQRLSLFLVIAMTVVDPANRPVNMIWWGRFAQHAKKACQHAHSRGDCNWRLLQ